MKLHELKAEGRSEEAVALLEQAAREHPEHREYRMRWLRERETLENRLIAQGDTALANGQLEQAKSAYAHALRIDPAQPRAAAGAASIAVARRHRSEVRAAKAQLAAGDVAGADARLRAVLAEDPNQREAKLLLRVALDRASAASLAPPQLTAAMGKTVTLEFRDARLQAVFNVLAKTTGINFVFDKDVKQSLRTTIVVRDASVDDVIKLILATNQLGRKVLSDRTLLIYPDTPAKQREYRDLVVRSFYIANADVKQVFDLVRTVVKTRDLYMDEKRNLLVMKDTPDAVRLAERLVAAQDLAEPEVTLQVEVLEIGSSHLQDLGVRFPDRVQFQDPSTVSAGDADFGGSAALQRLSGGLVGFVATPPILLNLKQQDSYTNVLANPRIRVKNREKARIHIGDRVPVITTTATANVGVSASIAYLDVGLKLEVEPTIHLDGEVDIKVGLEVSNIIKEVPVSGGGLAYQLGTRNAGTVLRLKDGETQVLAGLIQDDDRVTNDRVPGLGEFPVLGRLFSNKNTTHGKNEIVLLITPHIVRTLERPDHVAAEFYSGTETAIGAPPVRMRQGRQETKP